MANQYINKVIYGGKTLIDLSGDTVSADKLLKGLTAHDKSGAVITGTCTFDVDSGDADVAVAEILECKIAYARGAKVTGTMPNKGAVTGVIAAVADSFTIPLGYHDGSGSVAIKAEEQAKLVAANIREGVTILGVEGTMSGSENMKPQTNTVTAPAGEETYVAKVGNVNYTSLAEAFKAAKDGGTVELLRDVYVETWDQVWNVDRMTIKGNGKTVTIG